MSNLETAIQNVLQTVSPQQGAFGIIEAVIDTGDDNIRSLVLEALDEAKKMLADMSGDQVGASMADALKRETQAVFEAVKNAPRGQLPRSLIQRVNSCVQAVAIAYANSTVTATRSSSNEHSILFEVQAEQKHVAEVAANTLRIVSAPVVVPLQVAIKLVGGKKEVIVPAKALGEVDIEETAEDDARRAAPKDRQRIEAARAARLQARDSGTYRDRGRAARAQARLEATSRKDEDDREERLRNTDSAVVVATRGDLVQRADGVLEAGGRNTMDKLHEAGIDRMLKEGKLPRGLIASFDLNHDGKVEFWEFDRVRFEADISYQQIAALDGKRGYFDARTITDSEFQAAARAIGLLQTVSQAELNRLATLNIGNRTINQVNDGEITRNEVRRVINGLGMSVGQADFNHNGRLDRAELDAILLMAEVKEKLATNQVSMSYDTNRDGRVDYMEVSRALQAKGITRADQIDTDAEFRAAMGRVPAVPLKTFQQELAETLRECGQRGIALDSRYDTDRDGKVELNEAAAALRAKGITRADQIDTAAELRAALGPAAPAAPARPALRPRQG